MNYSLLKRQQVDLHPRSPKVINSDHARASMQEWIFIVLFLAFLFALRMRLTYDLLEFGVYSKFDVLFDADPNGYIVAFRDGYGYSRIIHPGIAILVNLPIRAIEACITSLGIAGSLTGSQIREHLALLIVPVASSVSGLFWWFAARVARFSVAARCAGVFILQLSFSQTIFGIIPESYALSGLLYSVLLWFVVKLVKNPELLKRTSTRISWLALACVMSAITVTNGFACICIWLALKYRQVTFKNLVKEGIIAGVLLSGGILSMIFLTQEIYQGSSQQVATVTTYVNKNTYVNPSNIIAMPAVLLNSVYVMNVDRLSVSLEENQDELPMHFSIQLKTKEFSMALLGWAAIIGFSYLFLRSSPPVRLKYALVSLLGFNFLIHSIFGAETFLYSQHWIGFVVFALVWMIRKESQRNTVVGLALCIAATFASVNMGLEILQDLSKALPNKQAYFDLLISEIKQV